MSTTEPRRILLGRADEMAQLADRFEAVQRDGARAVVVAGEPGIGKTTLVEEFVASIGGRARCAIVRCSPYCLDGLQAVQQLVESLAGDGQGAETGRSPAVAGSMPAISNADEARAVLIQRFAQLTSVLLDGIGADPTVMVIDDVHWGQFPLHELIAFFLEAVTARRLQHRLLVVLVTRVLPPPHPISALLEDLERHLALERIDVKGLAAGVIETLVVESVSSPARPRPSSAFVDLVQRSAVGNPLRARAALRVMERRGIDADVPTSDRRTWSTIRFVPELADPLTAWIGGLPSDLLGVLAACAAWAEEFTAADVEHLTGQQGNVQSHLHRAVSIELLETDGHAYWFGHPTFREVVIQLADVGQLQQVHASAVRLLQTTADASGRDVLHQRIGRHLLGAGTLVAGPEALAGLVEAGRSALTSFSWIEAARFLEAARQLIGAVRPEPAEAAELLALLGQALYFDHDFEAAGAVLHDAIDLAAACGAERWWGEALLTWLRIMTVTRTESLSRAPSPSAAQRFLDSSQDATMRSLILQVLAEQRITAGDTVAGAELAELALTEANRSGSRVARAFALYAGGLADQVALRLGPGLDGVEAARVEAEASGDWWTRGIMQARLPAVLLASGQIERADREAEAAVEAAARCQEHANQAVGYSARAQAALVRGEFDALDEFGRRSRSEVARSSYVLADLFTAPAVVLGQLYRGAPEEAARIIETWPNLPRSGRAALRAVLYLVGDTSHPVDIRPPRAPNQISVGFFAANLEVAARQGRRDDLDEGSALLEEWTAAGFELPPTYPSSLTRVRAEVELARGRQEEAGSLFRHAAAWAAANGAQAELARSLAGASRLSGVDPAEGEHLAARARAIASLISLDLRVLGLDPSLPDGPPVAGVGSEVAVLITDIVGSTTVSRQMGDLAYFELVMRHHELVRSCLHRASGHEFSESGDGLLAWFRSMPQALRAALDIQRRTFSARSRGGFQIKVSLAGGPTLMRAGRPYGLLVALAARLLEKAQPDEIVLDARAFASVPPEVRVERRDVELRGIGHQTMGVLRPG